MSIKEKIPEEKPENREFQIEIRRLQPTIILTSRNNSQPFFTEQPRKPGKS